LKIDHDPEEEKLMAMQSNNYEEDADFQELLKIKNSPIKEMELDFVEELVVKPKRKTNSMMGGI
jgi:hypothetical protein